jgi:hypothetical protein
MWDTADPALFDAYRTDYVLRMRAREKEPWKFNASHPRWLKVLDTGDIEVWEVVDPLITQEEPSPDEEDGE